jgi:hypothetical protein
VGIADKLNNPIFSDKYWELMEYYDYFGLAYPCIKLYNINAEPQEKNTTKLIENFNLLHHTQYNFMRQEEIINRKKITNDYYKTFDNNIINYYYNLKRFQNENKDIILGMANNKTRIRKPKHKSNNNVTSENCEDNIIKYQLDKTYLKYIEKIDYLLG